MKKSVVKKTEFEKLSWKEICMRLLHCFGERNNDWLHKHWHEHGIDKNHGRIITKQYEEWMIENGKKIIDYRKK